MEREYRYLREEYIQSVGLNLSVKLKYTNIVVCKPP